MSESVGLELAEVLLVLVPVQLLLEQLDVALHLLAHLVLHLLQNLQDAQRLTHASVQTASKPAFRPPSAAAAECPVRIAFKI